MCVCIHNSTEQGPSSEANSFQRTKKFPALYIYIYLFIYLCTSLHNSTEQGPSSEANSFQRTKKFPALYIYIYLFICVLPYTTPQSRVLLQKLTVSQQTKKLLAHIYICVCVCVCVCIHTHMCRVATGHQTLRDTD